MRPTNIIGWLDRNCRFTTASGPAQISSAAPAVEMTLAMAGAALSASKNTTTAAISAVPANELACAAYAGKLRLDDLSAAALRGMPGRHAARIPPTASSHALDAGR